MEEAATRTGQSIDELRGQLGDVGTDISNLAEKLGTTEGRLQDAYDTLREQMGEGFENTQAGQDALAELIGVTGNELRAGIDELGGQVTDLSTQLEDVRADVTQQITDLVAAGVDQQTATETAIQEYADANNLSFAEVNEQLGLVGGQLGDLATQLTASEEKILSRIAELEQSDISRDDARDIALQEYADANNLSFAEVNEQLGLVGGQLGDLATQLTASEEKMLGAIDQTQTDILEEVEALRLIGLDQNEALEAAIKNTAAETGQTIENVKATLDLGFTQRLNDVDEVIRQRLASSEEAAIARDVAAGGATQAGFQAIQNQLNQGVMSMATQKVGVADIGSPYDLRSSLLENMMRILSGESGESGYSEGGSVERYNTTDEIIELLRG